MSSSYNRPRGRQVCFAALTGILAATVLTGCGNDTTKADGGGEQKVAWLPKSDGKQTGSSGNGAPSGKKLKPGTPEAEKAFEAYRAAHNTCLTKTAQAAGIETKVMTEGKEAGEVIPREDMGSVIGKAGGVLEGGPLAMKWYKEIVPPCNKKVPAPQFEDDESPAEELAKAKKHYDCLNKAGLTGLHEPTNDNLALFTPEGLAKYYSPHPDPKAKEKVNKCDLNH
ncbi:hypothetical protein [Streptomyces melanogenes]|uniref:hypothetical protein n=1 Tax=Streptomyces melanogenes TaxID=67326 RepID=UPI00167DA939|nr:hypothetical protein [Streptomyces melanogenes]GGP86925.1 hypothetical protein GCM10010278_76960 [Streptomyces melanogenes]